MNTLYGILVCQYIHNGYHTFLLSEPKKAKKKDAKKGKVIEVPQPNLAEVTVCNSTGALHHLTFLDEAKIEVRTTLLPRPTILYQNIDRAYLQIGRVGGMPILVYCLKIGNPQVISTPEFQGLIL